MCGRFAQTVKYEKIMKDFDIHEITAIVEEIQAKYNCAPGQKAMVITERKGQKILDYLGWGISHIVKNGTSISLINIRIESFLERPSPNAERCVIPIDGFYEWEKGGKKPQPYFFCYYNREPMLLAGLYEKDSNDSRFAIVTTPAKGKIAHIHHRMPYILSKEDADAWLAGGNSYNSSKTSSPDDDNAIEYFKVSNIVNSVANETPECCQPYKERTLFSND